MTITVAQTRTNWTFPSYTDQFSKLTQATRSNRAQLDVTFGNSSNDSNGTTIYDDSEFSNAIGASPPGQTSVTSTPDKSASPSELGEPRHLHSPRNRLPMGWCGTRSAAHSLASAFRRAILQRSLPTTQPHQPAWVSARTSRRAAITRCSGWPLPVPAQTQKSGLMILRITWPPLTRSFRRRSEWTAWITQIFLDIRQQLPTDHVASMEDGSKYPVVHHARWKPAMGHGLRGPHDRQREHHNWCSHTLYIRPGGVGSL